LNLTLERSRQTASRAVDRIGEEPAFVVLVAAVAVWVAVFSWLVVLRQTRFGTFDFDLGIHDQAIWLLAHGKTFDTVRGLPVFGHHATFAYYLLAPLVWLGAGPNMWNVLQVVAIATCAIPIFQLARKRLSSAWIATVLGVVWLLQPPVQFFAWETFHPEVMAMPFLFWAYLFGEERRWRPFVACLLIALCWKEDVSLLVLGLGVLYLIRGRRRLGLAVGGVGLVWFLIVGAWLVPTLAGGRAIYTDFYGDLGHTPAQVVAHGVAHPADIVQRLSDNDASGYARNLLAPFAFTPLAAPEVLLLGLPQALINLLSSTASFTFDLRYHYGAMPMVALGIAMVEGVARIRRWARGREGVTRFTAGAAAACALAATCAWGPSPIGTEYHAGYWPLESSTTVAARNSDIARIGGSDGVSADYATVPHLTHRDVIYTYPNPWRNSNYGTDLYAHGDPSKVKWILVDTAMFQPSDTAILDDLLGGGEFVVRDQQGSVVLAERVKPPPG
jgi:uncharacterized membrane protein